MATTRDPRARRFREYVERLTVALGHADRHAPMRAYLTGLCLPGERKSIEPMAARVDPRHVRARHQSMHHFVANAPWDGAALLRVARAWVLEPMARHGPVAAWIVDDTAYPKKGRHSVGVARQYCGPLGKPDNCQVAVSVSLANDAVSLPVAYRLYLPESWAHDRRRRRAAGVPAAIEFQPKWQLALAELRALQAAGVPPAPVVADAAYGDITAFRESLTAAGLRGGRQGGHDGVAPRPGPPAPEAGAGPARPAVDPRAPDGPASAGAPQALGRRTARLGVADRDLARGHTRGHALPLCPAPDPARASRRAAIRPPPGRGAPDRVAAGRARAHEVLALDPAGADASRGSRAAGQTPLADRAGLPRAQGRAGAGSLRRAGLARVPSSWGALHRGVCLPGGRARDPFPPSASGLPPPRSPSQRFQAAGRSRCGLNAMCQRPSPRCTTGSPAPCSNGSPAARVVTTRGPADDS